MLRCSVQALLLHYCIATSLEWWTCTDMTLHACTHYQDFEKHKLDESNVGYQMLQRAGWKEGEGLGKDKEGNSAPGNIPHSYK
jgi:G-patch domain